MPLAQVSYGTAGPGRTGKNKREVLMEKFFGLKNTAPPSELRSWQV